MQNEIINIFEQANEKARKHNEGLLTYVSEDGKTRCKKCGEVVRSVKYFKSPAMLQAYPEGLETWSICKCKEEERKAVKAELKRLEKMAEIPNARREAFNTPELAKLTFRADTSPKTEQGQLTRRWVAHYEANKEKNNLKWLFFYGGCGTGKTFYAACIANAMIDRGYTVKMVTVAEIAAEIFSAQDKVSAYNKYNSYEILIIDDLGAECQTDYMLDIVYTVVNNRYNARKPMIITSNMTTAETGNPKDKRIERIMSRIWGLGYPMEFTGGDRRKTNNLGAIP